MRQSQCSIIATHSYLLKTEYSIVLNIRQKFDTRV